MKKRLHKHTRHLAKAGRRQNQNYLVIVRGWMLVVALALMLGVGAIIGRFLNERLNEAIPVVAGVQIEAK